jgi:hypothetical protein
VLLDRLAAVARPGAVLAVDDVRFEEETWQAWQDAARRPWCSHSLDLGRLGLLVVGEGPGRAHSLARQTGLWIVRRR